MKKILLTGILFFLSCTVAVAKEHEPIQTKQGSLFHAIFFDQKHPEKTFSKVIKCPLRDTEITHQFETTSGQTYLVLCHNQAFQCHYTTYDFPLAGCRPIDQQPIQITKGMKKSEVIGLLGEPQKKEDYNGEEQYKYENIYVYFKDDVVIHWHKY